MSAKCSTIEAHVIKRDEPDFEKLVRACCACGPAERQRTRDVFREAWHPYLEAALARVSGAWKLAESVYPQVYDDYARIFQRPFDARIDYPTWLLATAYARLAEARRQRPLAFAAVDLAWAPHLTPLETDVLLFCAILRLQDACRFHLLKAAFAEPARQRAAVRSWFSAPPPAEPPAVTACLSRLVAVLHRRQASGPSGVV
jgi:hypothetical protein